MEIPQKMLDEVNAAVRNGAWRMVDILIAAGVPSLLARIKKLERQLNLTEPPAMIPELHADLQNARQRIDTLEQELMRLRDIVGEEDVGIIDSLLGIPPTDQ